MFPLDSTPKSPAYYRPSMKLNYREFGGEGHAPMILLHGLLGSSRNWVTVGKLLAEHFHVFALDLRNHGTSPHSNEIDYATMAGDVLEWMDAQNFAQVHIVGHSMGGKTAMWLACKHPHRLSSLTIADIAPKSYAPHFRIAFEGMNQINPNRYRRISEVEHALSAVIDDSQLRQFLVTNLVRNENGTFDWQINLPGLTDSLAQLSANPIEPDMHFNGPCLLLHGEKSDFVSLEDHTEIMHHFPNCNIIEVPNAGHNVHVENRSFFAEKISAFVK